MIDHDLSQKIIMLKLNIFMIFGDVTSDVSH